MSWDGHTALTWGNQYLANENQAGGFLCVQGPLIPLQGKEKRNGVAVPLPLVKEVLGLGPPGGRWSPCGLCGWSRVSRSSDVNTGITYRQILFHVERMQPFWDLVFEDIAKPRPN